MHIQIKATFSQNKADSPVRIQDKRNVTHLAICQSLFESDSLLLKMSAGRLNIIYDNGDMAKALPWFAVPVRISLEVGVAFGAVIVSELKDTCRE